MNQQRAELRILGHRAQCEGGRFVFDLGDNLRLEVHTLEPLPDEVANLALLQGLHLPSRAATRAGSAESMPMAPTCVLRGSASCFRELSEFPLASYAPGTCSLAKPRCCS